MTRFFKSLFATLLLSALASTAAHAQARTFVSAVGNDANACSVTAPCRTLQRGIDAVAAGGDVLIVDAGGFGANVTIAKSVSVIAPPGNQSRIALGGDSPTGITVSGDGIAVSISNLGISGAGGNGVFFISGTSLSLSGMDINVPAGGGITTIAGGGHLTVANTSLRNASLCFGAQAQSDPPARATIVNSHAENCNTGFAAFPYSTISITDSSAGGIPSVCQDGFQANGTQATLTLDGVVVSHCNRGIRSRNSGATVTVSNSLLTGNNTAGMIATSGVGRSYGNNRIFGNGVDALTGFTAIAEQ